MEKELGERFAEAELKQKKLMDIKVDQQKKVFDRMNYTKSELEKIVKKFAETNIMCEKLAKENEKLKLDLETSINLNKMLEKQLIKLQKENNRVEIDYNNIANNLIEENSNENESKNLRTMMFNRDLQQKMKINNFKPMENFKISKNQNPYKIFDSVPINNINKNEKTFSFEKLNNIYTNTHTNTNINEKNDIYLKNKIISRGVSANYRDNLTPNQLEIKKLKFELEKTQKEYNIIYKKFIESQKIKTDAQQLLQKCIEDVQIQLSQTNLKYNEQNQNGKLSEEERNNIKSLISSLEQKLKVLTFIYDNGIQNLKSLKTGLFYVK